MNDENRLEIDDVIDRLRAIAVTCRSVSGHLDEVANHLDRINRIVRIPAAVAGKIKDVVGKLKFWDRR